MHARMMDDAANDPVAAPVKVDLRQVKAAAQQSVAKAAALASTGTAGSISLARRLLQGVLLMLQAVMRLLGAIAREFRIGVQKPVADSAQNLHQAAQEAAEVSVDKLHAVTRDATRDEVPDAVEIVGVHEHDRAAFEHAANAGVHWAAQRLMGMPLAAGESAPTVADVQYQALVEALQEPVRVYEQAVAQVETAHAELLAAAGGASERAGVPDDGGAAFGRALAGYIENPESVDGSHLIAKMMDLSGQFSAALVRYRDSIAAQKIARDRVVSILPISGVLTDGLSERLVRELSEQYPVIDDVLQPLSRQSTSTPEGDGESDAGGGVIGSANNFADEVSALTLSSSVSDTIRQTETRSYVRPEDNPYARMYAGIGSREQGRTERQNGTPSRERVSPFQALVDRSAPDLESVNAEEKDGSTHGERAERG